MSQQAVSKQVKRGRIVLLPDGTIDPAQADAAWPRRSGNGHRRPRDDYDPLELEKARAEKTRLEARLRALELRLREGALVDRALVLDRVNRSRTRAKVLLWDGTGLCVYQHEDGTLTARHAGTPQGGVVSPLLANIFLHLVFDAWMERTFPQVPFERYADDVLVHCRTKEQAEDVRQAVAERLARCKLEVHPSKTRIVYCQDSNRRASYPVYSFDFLGFTFRPRRSRNRSGR